MLIRCISGVILAIIAIATMFIGGPVLAGVLLLTALIAYRELTKALKVNIKEKGFLTTEIIGFIGIVLYYAAVYFGNDTLRLMCIVGVFMAQVFLYVITFPKYKAQQIIGSVFSFLYAPVMLSFIYLTRSAEHGFFMVWLILFSSWVCDTCAYFVGVTIGRKKVFPILSPKKSLEGCIGGVVGSAIVGGLYSELILDKAMPEQNLFWIMIFICAVGAVMSMVGDLVASAIKRENDIKDYGKLIPGHGGIMDRFDSMIVTAPMIYFLCVLMIYM